MTQTPRDWHKDEALLQLCQSTAADENEKHALSIGIHWLQEAQRHIEAWEVLAEMKVSDMHQSEIRDFAKQMLKGRAPYKLNEEAVNAINDMFLDLLSTLYPDIPAPKEGE